MSKNVTETAIDLSNEVALAAIEKVLKDYSVAFKSKEALNQIKIRAIISILKKMELLDE